MIILKILTVMKCYGCNNEVWSGSWYDKDYYSTDKDILFCGSCIMAGVPKKLQTITECPHVWNEHERINVCKKCHKILEKG